jgi:drug/metabolite transporter (DMT)-like permease
MPGWSSIALALGAAALFGLTSALQHRSATTESRHRVGDPRLLLRLLGRPLWLSSLLSNGGAVALQILALHSGTLVVVQSLLVSSIILALPLEAALNRRPLERRQVLGATLGTVGIALFVVSARPAAGITRPSPGAWSLVFLTSAVVAVGCLLGAWTSARKSTRTSTRASTRASTGHARAILLGLATGVMYGLAAALFKTCSRLITHPAVLLSDWPVYVLVVVGVLGVVLNQNVYQAGVLAPGLTSLTLAEPITAVVIGTTAFREHLHLSPASLGAFALAGLVILAGLWLITTTRARPDTEAGC